MSESLTHQCVMPRSIDNCIVNKHTTPETTRTLSDQKLGPGSYITIELVLTQLQKVHCNTERDGVEDFQRYDG